MKSTKHQSLGDGHPVRQIEPKVYYLGPIQRRNGQNEPINPGLADLVPTLEIVQINLPKFE